MELCCLCMCIRSSAGWQLSGSAGARSRVKITFYRSVVASSESDNFTRPFHTCKDHRFTNVSCNITTVCISYFCIVIMLSKEKYPIYWQWCNVQCICDEVDSKTLKCWKNHGATHCNKLNNSLFCDTISMFPFVALGIFIDLALALPIFMLKTPNCCQVKNSAKLELILFRYMFQQFDAIMISIEIETL